jgi:hypothetical protein
MLILLYVLNMKFFDHQTKLILLFTKNNVEYRPIANGDIFVVTTAMDEGNRIGEVEKKCRLFGCEPIGYIRVCALRK